MSIVSCKPTITRKELEGVLDSLMHDELGCGITVKTFENKFSELFGIKYCLAVNSLTAAYHLAFRSLEIGPGDEVIISSYFNAAPMSALSLTGGTPVVVDIDEGSFVPSEALIKEKITEKTKAIVYGQMLGFLSDPSFLKEIKIPVVEDISYSIGADITEPSHAPVGAIMVASFAPSMMITTGNGGMVMTANSRYYSSMKELRGDSENGDHLNYEYAMTDFQSAMGISQLHRLAPFVKRRREIARAYYDAIKITPHKTVYAYSDAFVYQAFPVIFDAPIERIEKYWKKAAIEIYRPVRQPLHALLGLKAMDYPNSDRLSKKLFSLPIFPSLSKREIDKIARALANFI